MRQERSPEELLASWTLVEGDWKLVANKAGATRLGFCGLTALLWANINPCGTFRLDMGTRLDLGGPPHRPATDG